MNIGEHKIYSDGTDEDGTKIISGIVELTDRVTKCSYCEKHLPTQQDYYHTNAINGLSLLLCKECFSKWVEEKHKEGNIIVAMSVNEWLDYEPKHDK